MNKFFAAFCAAAAAAFAATPASAATIVVHDIIVQRGIWVQLMGLFGY